MAVQYKLKDDFSWYAQFGYEQTGEKNKILSSIYSVVFNDRENFVDWLEWYISDLTIDELLDEEETYLGPQLRASYESYCRTQVLDEFTGYYEVIKDE